ncbi:MAG: hypothetical protein US76_02690 [Parcubacteria group bacterium GW2011_GWA2_38_13b]|nr:MAG: hypothetical protein US76_02690 [Parcubacteria group bacterium GW2011_GWA2_38_13b]
MPKILLVEDDQFIAQLYSEKFSKFHYETEVVRDGFEALEILKKYKPDLILLDIVMPKMDGFEFLAHIKRDDLLKKILVLMFTNLSDKADIEKAKSLGAESYIIKSHFTPAEVVDRVNILLKRKSH